MAEYPTTPKAAKELGVRFYFTGNPCKKGHVSKRQASDAACVACKREAGKANAEYHTEYYAKNSEKLKANGRANYRANLEKDPDLNAKLYARTAEAQKLHREENREKRKKNSRDHYAENRAHHLAYAERYRELNKEAMLAYSKRHYAERRDYYFERAATRRAAKLMRTPKWLCVEDLHIIRSMYAERARLSEVTGIVFHVDHIVPLQGVTVSGLHVPCNLQIITGRDNIAKSNKFIERAA